MCCCGKPTINGQPGYSWDGKSFSTRPVSPPDLAEGEKLIYDEPGRCGGIDCHSHHFRVVKGRYSGHLLLVRHGGGDERIGFGCTGDLMLPSLDQLDSNARYWLLHTIYSTHDQTQRETRDSLNAKWRQAAADGRIRTRKNRSRGTVKVWIEDPPKMEDGSRDQAA